MCDTCGCGDPALVPVDVHEKILAGNDRAAAHNRGHFRERHVTAVNLMGSPGSGKTAELEAKTKEFQSAVATAGIKLGGNVAKMEVREVESAFT